MNETMIIVGAGIAGLATGCYAQMNGFRSQIFEKHDKPGGLCTSWRRQGYTIDGCIHWLMGSGPGSPIHHIWQELGAVQNRPMIYHEEFTRVEAPDGKAFTVYCDIDRLAAHMKELSPADAALIDEFAQAAHRFRRFDLLALMCGAEKPWDLMNPLDWVRLVAEVAPHAMALAKWMRMTIGDWAARLSDPFLKQAFLQMSPLFTPDMPMGLFMANLAAWHDRTAGWPSGGSLAFAQAIAQRYQELGGEIHYRSPVAEIVVEKEYGVPYEAGMALGVRLRDGSTHGADIVVSAADGYNTIYNLLGGRYKTEEIRRYYEQVPTSQSYAVHVSLGVARDFSGEPHALTLLLDKPVMIAGQERHRLDVEIYNFDPALAPKGKTLIKVPLVSGYGYWAALYDTHRGRYVDEKQRTAETVAEILERRFPGLMQRVEMVDVATPITTERFTGNWRGLQPWLPKEGFWRILRKGLSRTLPNLDNFYMVGQWSDAMIGVSTAAISGRNLIRRLCRKYRRRFNAQVSPSEGT